MLKHFIKLIWNRKRANLLIMTEVAITFLVLFAVMSMAWHYWLSYTSPLGYQVENTWSVRLSNEARWNNETDRPVLNQIVEVLRQQPEIASVELSRDPILQNSQWSSSESFEGIQLSYDALVVSDNGPKAWGVKLNDGRWFSEVDEGQGYRPVIVNQLFVDKYFKHRSVIGLEINHDNPEVLPKRIVGVFDAFRQRGDFQQPLPMMMYRYSPTQGSQHGMGYVHIKFNAPQTAAYEQTLFKKLKTIAPHWEYKIHTWQSLRENINEQVTVPMTILAIVVGFLLMMVAMGLFGILWQNINQRTAEVGLRRAIGASSDAIVMQVVGEMIVLAMFAMLIVTPLLLQVPLLELVDTVTWDNFFVSLFGAMAVILLVVVLCALYPAYVAVNKSPALALHYE